ncbi:MAG: phosphoglycerate dehydrogenase [Chloroflexi bacterium]|nr:MAG: phosphoglycerate dehydrogenase [Chloroflexota bacterium]
MSEILTDHTTLDTSELLPAMAADKPDKFKILVATDLTDESIAFIEECEGCHVLRLPPTNLTAIRDGLMIAHALIARDDVPVDAALLEHAKYLRVIARVGAGLNHLDVDAATERGIIVMHTPGTNAIAAAEHTLTLMLALSRKLVAVHDSLKDGWWLLDRKRQAGVQLHGKTLGIIGFGKVGRGVAKRCLAFGMTVLAYDPYISEEQLDDERVLLVGFDELLQRSDYISLHVAATRETERIIDADVIQQMKPGTRLINTAYGGAVDEDALAQAVKDGHLAGVAVDVFSEEPPYNSPLIGLDNVIHTPHIGDNTVEAAQDLSIQIVRQVIDALHGKDYRNVVNMPFLPGVDFGRVQPYLILAERIGMLQHALAHNPIRRVAVEYRGEEVAGLVKPLTVALLKGLLTPILGAKVNYINAPLIAHERGLQVTQTKGLKTGSYTNLVSCEVRREDGSELVMAGTLFDQSEPRIVQIDEYRMDFVPEGHLLIAGSYDKPGVIGRVGTFLAENDINVASWRTGRATPGGHTLTVITLDHFLPDDALETLRQQDFIRHAIQVEIQ